MKKLLLIIAASFTFSVVATVAQAENKANYYRFWQGFKRTDLTANQFLAGLTPFMQSTVDVYSGKGINNYMVGLPPAGKPEFLPDEFALVAFDSEASYDAVKATPEGAAYIDSHWQHFDQNTSASAPMVNLDDSVREIQFGTAYNILAAPVDWARTSVLFYVGLRKDSVTAEDFRSQMTKHIRDVSVAFGSHGLVGYLMLATENYEVAYMAFTDASTAQADFATPEGQKVAAEAGAMMNTLMFTTSEPFAPAAGVQSNHFYSTFK